MYIEANIKCIKEIWSEHEGEWVAIENGKLLNHSDNYKELFDKFKYVRDVVITRLVW